ncbi:PQQ-binding-like beta-propeller repeat protein [Sphingomonas sp. LB-2]|uniref:outer membrane protein assembly factor BamB family protein n=1 Tax=Sphingomonas caeni TaxID=2984949 RepID=UPI002231C2EF|nr:PQQ-binding-like beta-propeller repeat protein [Sphingomonas caeni]MCW3846485.1 PQQ-binding-like beta-propeller repeat protein [Sphingomonas caeni]
MRWGVLLSIVSLGLAGPTAPAGDWAVYGGAYGDRYSPLAQITAKNVARLEQVWRFDTGEGGLQTQPLMAGGMLYAATPQQHTIALDAATGKPVWEYVPESHAEQGVRGLTWWQSGGEQRLFTSADTYLIALDPRTGRPIPGFGKQGRVDLREGLGRDPATLATYLTTPGVIFGDLIITGFRTSETRPAAPGAIRAYDVRTGALRWTFNLIPKAGEPGYETWEPGSAERGGAANNWAGMVVDPARGIVFVPTGSAVDDFYGGDRKGDNLYANSLVALDARTGKRLWHFQAVHHDVLDRDFPSPPVLLTVTQRGRRIDAVAQATKQGVVFLFNRVTGKPLFPIEERAVPQSDVPGEATAPTQPFPLKPAPYARQILTAETLTQRTPEANAWARKAFAGMRSDGPFTPLPVDGNAIVFPGYDGGAEWGGQAADPSGVLYINSNNIAWTGGLVLTRARAERGAMLYEDRCSTCHGLDRTGDPPAFPSLIDIGKRLTRAQIEAVIHGGKGRMPGFPQIAGDDLDALIGYLRDSAPDKAEVGGTGAAAYRFTGYHKFLDPEGYPAIAPPWGTLSAIDMNSGDYLWQVPLGSYPELVAKGMQGTGSENYGGPIVTAGGVLFIGATVYDRRLHAFDARTGKLLWEGALPFAGTATPITYMAGGRQFVVIATSGARDPKGPRGSAYVAFALPGR